MHAHSCNTCRDIGDCALRHVENVASAEGVAAEGEERRW